MIGVVLMDLGVQSIQVAAQASVISLLPEARSRLNTLYMVARFGGGAAGSALGALVWSWAKWPGVCALCLGLSVRCFARPFHRFATGRSRRTSFVVPGIDQGTKPMSALSHRRPVTPAPRWCEASTNLSARPFADGVNALCWPRTLPGDFREVVEALGPGEGIVTVDESYLGNLPLSDAGKTARDILLADQQMLRACDLQPSLDCVHGGVREEPEGLFHTDVYSWHIDTATVPADTWLCTYVGATSEGLQNDEAVRRVDIPVIRAELLRLYGGNDDAGFLEYLAENFYDLHYAPLPKAQPFCFGVGNLWRIAVAYPDSPVPPCVHRAPLTLPGMPARLLLIS